MASPVDNIIKYLKNLFLNKTYIEINEGFSCNLKKRGLEGLAPLGKTEGSDLKGCAAGSAC